MSGVIGGVIKPAAVALNTGLSPPMPKLVVKAPLVSDGDVVGVVTVAGNADPHEEMTVGCGDDDDVTPACMFDDVPEVATVEVTGSKDDTVVEVEAAEVRVDTGDITVVGWVR